MMGYTTLGTTDLERAEKFYNALFATVGVSQLWNHDGMIAWARGRGEVAFCVKRPFDREDASVGNGVMIALRMEDRAQVDAMHAKALEMGGADEGAPGPRGEHGFYGGYFRDPDSNRLNAYVPG